MSYTPFRSFGVNPSLVFSNYVKEIASRVGIQDATPILTNVDKMGEFVTNLIYTGYRDPSYWNILEQFFTRLSQAGGNLMPINPDAIRDLLPVNVMNGVAVWGLRTPALLGAILGWIKTNRPSIDPAKFDGYYPLFLYISSGFVTEDFCRKAVSLMPGLAIVLTNIRTGLPKMEDYKNDAESIAKFQADVKAASAKIPQYMMDDLYKIRSLPYDQLVNYFSNEKKFRPPTADDLKTAITTGDLKEVANILYRISPDEVYKTFPSNKLTARRLISMTKDMKQNDPNMLEYLGNIAVWSEIFPYPDELVDEKILLELQQDIDKRDDLAIMNDLLAQIPDRIISAFLTSKYSLVAVEGLINARGEPNADQLIQRALQRVPPNWFLEDDYKDDPHYQEWKEGKCDVDPSTLELPAPERTIRFRIRAPGGRTVLKCRDVLDLYKYILGYQYDNPSKVAYLSQEDQPVPDAETKETITTEQIKAIREHPEVKKWTDQFEKSYRRSLVLLREANLEKEQAELKEGPLAETPQQRAAREAKAQKIGQIYEKLEELTPRQVTYTGPDNGDWETNQFNWKEIPEFARIATFGRVKEMSEKRGMFGLRDQPPVITFGTGVGGQVFGVLIRTNNGNFKVNIPDITVKHKA